MAISAAAAPAYRAMLDDLFRRRRFGVKLDLTGPREALARLGDPVRALPVIQIGGTNGKGSTAAMVEAMLRASGRRTGLYTSPHLCRFTERIRVGGEELAPDEAAEGFARVTAVAPDLTFFEVATLMAALAFAAHGVEVAVVEVGLGGRLDATNVFSPVASGLGPIGREHTAYLGQSLARIAWEKGMLLRPGVPAATLATRDPAVAAVLRRLAEVKGTPLLEHGRDFRLAPRAGGGWRWDGPGGPLSLAAVPLAGAHQVENAALALALVALLPPALRPAPEACSTGLARTAWPGRLELLPGPPRVLLDAGHNPQAAEALVRALADHPRRRLHLVFAAMGDKEVSRILPPLAALADAVWLTRVAYWRGAEPAALLRHLPEPARARVVPDVPGALAAAQAAAGPEDLVLVTGSVFLVGEARAHLLGEPTDPVRVTDPVGDRGAA